MLPDPARLSCPLLLDVDNACLRCGEQLISLRPKTFAVLRCLVEHPGRLLTKAVLLDAVWPNTIVSDVGLMVCIRELRQVLGDDPKTPQFIATVHRQGYRFIADVMPVPGPAGEKEMVQITPHTLPARSWSPEHESAPLIGREAELGQLYGYLEQAQSGGRQVVFVTGEAGLGKTTLVRAFVEAAQRRGVNWIGWGQCIEHYGIGEGYRPVLEAFGRLCQAPGGKAMIALLSRRAPTWLVQMPWLVSPIELESLQRQIAGATRERMLREMTEALNVLTTEQPLLLVLEDLHWSDPSTLDLLIALAQRQEPSQLLLIGTYRPSQASINGHPLYTIKQELQARGRCEEVSLTLLSEAAVGNLLREQLTGAQLPFGLTRFVHQRTDGNPFFVVNVVNYLMAQGLLVQTEGQWVLAEGLDAAGVPGNLQLMIETQLDRLSPQAQRVLEAASVAGVVFSAASVAAGLRQGVIRIESACEHLARHSPLLQSSGDQSWPDGTTAGSYRFVHVLYQEVVYNRITAARRVQLHRRIGERMVAAYGSQATERAAELAMHFERGQDVPRAILYARQAADNAIRKHANAEAIGQLKNALKLLHTLPSAPECRQEELLLQCALGASLTAAKGYAAPEVEQAFTRAYDLCQQLGETLQLFPVLWGLAQVHHVREDFRTSRQLGKQLLQLAEQGQDPVRLLAAHNGFGTTLFYLAEFSLARYHLAQSSSLYHVQTSRPDTSPYGIDLGVDSLGHEAHVLWLLGYPEQALQGARSAVALAQKLSHPFTLVHVMILAATVHQLCDDVQLAQKQAETGLALSREHGFSLESGRGLVLLGWALARKGHQDRGIQQIRKGLATYRATGARASQSYVLTLLAQLYAAGGQSEAGLKVVDKALTAAHETGGRYSEAELYRLKGELLLLESEEKWTEAESCFHQALDIACRQQAKSWELRAATSLARLWQSQGKRQEAYELLALVYEWFTEGFDTADLKDARALLDELQ